MDCAKIWKTGDTSFEKLLTNEYQWDFFVIRPFGQRGAKAEWKEWSDKMRQFLLKRLQIMEEIVMIFITGSIRSISLYI
jgi:hypothetical protein